MSDGLLEGVRIARVSTVAFFVETQLRSQIEAIVEAGASVTIVASESNLLQKFPDVKYVSIDIPRKIKFFSDIVALYKLWRFFVVHKFDIVHSTTPKAALLCCIAGVFSGIKLRLHTFTGQPWVDSTKLTARFAKAADWLVAHLNTYCYADSCSQSAFLVESGVVRQGGCAVLGEGSLAGVDLKRFDPDRFSVIQRLDIRKSINITSNSLVILFVGRCTRDKGIAELIMAFDRVLQSDLDVSLVIVGPFEQDAQEIIIGVPPKAVERIVFTGYSDCPEQYMAIADVLAIPSYREGFGTVVIEAAAMGLPAVGSDIYGLQDAIVDGETGVLVPPRNVEELAVAMETLCRDAERRTRLGKNAQNRARSAFSSEIVNSLVVGEYARLLAECAAGSAA